VGYLNDSSMIDATMPIKVVMVEMPSGHLWLADDFMIPKMPLIDLEKPVVHVQTQN
jgi:hypothetical protein